MYGVVEKVLGAKNAGDRGAVEKARRP